MSSKIRLKRSRFRISWQCETLLSANSLWVNCCELHQITFWTKQCFANCYAKVESTLRLAAKGNPFDEHLLAIWSFYVDDLDQHSLHTQLIPLGMLFEGLHSINIPFFINRLQGVDRTTKRSVFRNRSFGQTSFACSSYQCYISKRFCSTQKRIETYLHSTMTQNQLSRLQIPSNLISFTIYLTQRSFTQY